METPQLIALNLILLMLAFVMNARIHAETVMDVQAGEASYYAESLHGNKTASGEAYDKDAMTAAHRSLPFGTKVKVTYLKTGKSVKVVINDRGPHVKGRIIDLSGAAARALGLIEDGHGQVKLEVVAP
jgi:rare lipoprotein A